MNRVHNLEEETKSGVLSHVFNQAPHLLKVGKWASKSSGPTSVPYKV